MLPKRYRLSKKSDFSRIKRVGRVVKGRFLLFSFRRRGDDGLPRFGFIVGRSFSRKASRRNLLKRRLREGVRAFLSNYKGGLGDLDVCLVARSEAGKASYENLRVEVGQILSGIFKL